MKLNVSKILYESYFVNDTQANDYEIIFILESPSSKEIIHKHPAAGKSGKTMSKAICNIAKPLGCLIKNKQNIPYKIKLMNVSCFPMKMTDYLCDIKDNPDIDENSRKFVKNLCKTKKDFETRLHENVDISDSILILLLNNFMERLMIPPGLNNKLIIPCGYFAQNFMNFAIELFNNGNNSKLKIEISENELIKKVELLKQKCSFYILYSIPHPAQRSGWKDINIPNRIINAIEQFRQLNHT